jgi:DNA-binding LytR/AlgR family response regulator
MKVLIIEDEKVTANNLVESLTEIRPDYLVVEIIPSIEESINFLKQNQNIDLIFSDIQLTDGLSFEIFKQLETNIPVIFCTAYDEFAMEAFNANGIAYLLKPFDSNKLKIAIEKFEGLVNKNSNAIQHLLQYLAKPKLSETLKSILVYQNEKIIPVNIDDIALMYLNNSIVKLITFDNRILFSTQSLDDFEKLNAPLFFRANRQFIIHRKAVQDASQHFNRKLLVNLNFKFSEQILISKEKTPLFLNWLSNN